MKTVIEMAREAGYMKTVQGGAEVSMASMDCLERFAELVRADEREVRSMRWDEYIAKAIADEREACAQFLESTQLGSLPEDTALHYARLLKGFAEGIRNRSNK